MVTMTPQTPTAPRVHTLAAGNPTQPSWLLAYDIKDAKRLQRVGRYLAKEGVRLQYSVYWIKGGRPHIDKILAHLATLTNAKHDDVRAYPMGANTRLWGLGTQFSQDDTLFFHQSLEALITAHNDTPLPNPSPVTLTSDARPSSASASPSACQTTDFDAEQSQSQPRNSGD